MRYAVADLVLKKSEGEKKIIQIGSDSQGNPRNSSANVATEIVLLLLLVLSFLFVCFFFFTFFFYYKRYLAISKFLTEIYLPI